MALCVGKYRLGRKLGSGSFGETYVGVHIDTGEQVAIKLEPKSSKHLQLAWEYKIYKSLKSDAVSPAIYWYGAEGDFYCLIMQYLGKNLEDLFQANRRRFRTATVIALAVQMFDRVRQLHDVGFIHRDIKPDNFLMGRGDLEGMVYLIDFGLSKRYKVNDQHIPFRTDKSLTGTARYCALSNHEGHEQSRKDDIEAIGYVLIYFMLGQLPWQGLAQPSGSDKYYNIYMKKRSTNIGELCAKIPAEFAQVVAYARTLKFTDRPDYDYLKNLFIGLHERLYGNRDLSLKQICA